MSTQGIQTGARRARLSQRGVRMSWAAAWWRGTGGRRTGSMTDADRKKMVKEMTCMRHVRCREHMNKNSAWVGGLEWR